MKEIVFLNKNAKRWKEYNNLLDYPDKISSDKLANIYIELTDDLAYAQTYYPESETEQFLNNLTVKSYRFIYQTKKEKSGRILKFWKYDFPLEIYKTRKYLLYSFIIFLISSVLGAVSAASDSEFVELILGSGYVYQTKQNIAEGNPMGVYQTMGSLFMFLIIVVNNLWVATLEMLLGVFTAFGTAFILIRNGVMLGSFQYFFYEYNVFYESVITIWIHGTIEILSIIVAGAAGFVLGTKMMFPGTYSRTAAFIEGGKTGARIILGLTPFIIVAAILESWVTRHVEWHDSVQIAIIVSSLVLMVWYFVFYPVFVHKKTTQTEWAKG